MLFMWAKRGGGSAGPAPHLRRRIPEKSEKYGLVVYLCHRRCHIFAPSAVHQSTGQMQRLKRYGQLKAMQEQRWTEDDFRREFGKAICKEENDGKQNDFAGAALL